MKWTVCIRACADRCQVRGEPVTYQVIGEGNTGISNHGRPLDGTELGLFVLPPFGSDPHSRAYFSKVSRERRLGQEPGCRHDWFDPCPATAHSG